MKLRTKQQRALAHIRQACSTPGQEELIRKAFRTELYKAVLAAERAALDSKNPLQDPRLGLELRRIRRFVIDADLVFSACMFE